MFHGSGWWSFISYDDTKSGPKIDRQLLARVAVWIRPYTVQIAMMLVLLLAIALVELVPPLLYGGLINGLANRSLSMSGLNWMALGLLAVPTLSTLLGTGQRYLSASIGESLIYDLRLAMYGHMQRMGLRFFTETKTGDIISRFASDVVGAQSAVTNTVPNLLTNVLTLVTTLAIMLRLDWRLTLVAVAALPLFLLPTRRVGRILRRIRREAAGHDARMSSQVQETLNVSGALLVRSFGRGQAETARFGEAAGAVRDIGVRRAVVGRWFFTGLGIAAALGTALMYWFGGYFVLQVPPGQTGLQPGDLVTFAAYVARLYGPVSGLSNLQVEFMTSLVSFERVFEYLDLPIEIDEVAQPVELDRVEGRLSFEDVWFDYGQLPPALAAARRAAPPKAADAADASEVDGAGTAESQGAVEAPAASAPTGSADLAEAADREPSWALQSVDFEVPPGGLVALVGPSGAGKTSVSYLVARFYDPSRGRVRLDGHDLRDLSLASIARHVGMVTQEAYLFHDSIRANLAFGRPESTPDEIEAACRAANIHDRILELPEGYETVVGERGYRLSGGEKQRLALARVILKNPSIIVLDEATSHLDSQNEALIQDALEQVMRSRTSVVIAHRLSTILAADLILVLERGRIVERGSHDALLAQGGLYAELFETQFRQPEGV
ncbi:MAG: ABC transporter ATP-binding protein [Chloroflexi bacterium]|nr:ABC transporter ATP-binding protein [Chloroflexota bacterium]